MSPVLALPPGPSPDAALERRTARLEAAARRALEGHGGEVLAVDRGSGHLIARIWPGTAWTVHPVGSLAKLVTARAITRSWPGAWSATWTCPGAPCWRAHGRIDLAGALAHSCRVPLAAAGERLGPQALVGAFEDAGFDIPPVTALAGRPPGTLGRLATGEDPRVRADSEHVARFVRRLAAEPGPWHPALARAVQEGTGRLARIPGADIRGKTGTVEVPGDRLRRDGWFAGYSERLVVVTRIPGSTGFAGAAPVAGAVFRADRP
ncbi:MAG: penicillin-binding transpeptidase domain-containing protein [bacterium]|nr:penicillin-binding transpeptidase domain-containing protein [bacterium]